MISCRCRASPCHRWRSRTGPWFRDVVDETVANLRALLAVPEDHHVVFCPGGATQQFSMVPMNLLRGGDRQPDYVVTGSWGVKAATEARKEGRVRIAWSDAEHGYARVPSTHEIETALSADAVYVHITTNETIEGVQWRIRRSPPTASSSPTPRPTSCRVRSTSAGSACCTRRPRRTPAPPA